jgi:hypothetical protein
MEQATERLLPDHLGPEREVAMEAFARTQRALRARGRSLGLALVCVALVFACLPDEGRGLVSGFRQGGIPLAGALLAVGAWFFWRFVQASRQLGGTGLAPQRSNAARGAWAFGGWLAGLALGEMLCVAFGWPASRSILVAAPMSGAMLWLGEKLGELAEPSAVRHIHTLFEHEDPDKE